MAVMYCIAQNFDEESFDKWCTLESINREVGRENFDESLAIRQIHKKVFPSNFCTMRKSGTQFVFAQVVHFLVR